MLPSTFAALRTQGIDTEPLRRACLRCFDAGTFCPAEAQAIFWSEFVACRRAFRDIAGTTPEAVLAHPDRPGRGGGIDIIDPDRAT